MAFLPVGLLCSFFLLTHANLLPNNNNTRPVKAGRHEGTAAVGGTFGLDVSSLIYPDTFKCLKNNGMEFVIVRAYRSDCKYMTIT